MLLEDYEEWLTGNRCVDLSGHIISSDIGTTMTLQVRVYHGSIPALLDRVQQAILFCEETEVC